MGLDRNHPCACGSGRKVKHCHLDAMRAWQQSGGGLIAAWVELPDGTLCPVDEYDGPLREDTRLAIKLNPITEAWLRDAVPPDTDFQTEAFRGQALEHLARLTGGRVSDELTAELDAYLRRQ